MSVKVLIYLEPGAGAHIIELNICGEFLYGLLNDIGILVIVMPKSYNTQFIWQ